jgi:transposase
MPEADAAPALPDDVAILKAMVLAQTAELAEIRTQRQAQEAELAAARAGLIEQRFEIEALKSRLARLQRMTFGRSSEKLRDQVEQLELTLADIDELLGEITPANDPADEPAEIPARKPARRPLPEALPRDIVEHPAPCACPDCGGVLRPFGEDVTEILDYVPGSFRVVRHVRPKLSCRACETIVQAPAPSLPIRRGRAGAGLLAHVLVAKYCDHLPLHRQAEIHRPQPLDAGRPYRPGCGTGAATDRCLVALRHGR